MLIPTLISVCTNNYSLDTKKCICSYIPDVRLLEYSCQLIVHQVYCYYAEGYLFSYIHIESTKMMPNSNVTFASCPYAHAPFQVYWNLDQERSNAKLQKAI